MYEGHVIQRLNPGNCIIHKGQYTLIQSHNIRKHNQNSIFNKFMTNKGEKGYEY